MTSYYTDDAYCEYLDDDHDFGGDSIGSLANPASSENEPDSIAESDILDSYRVCNIHPLLAPIEINTLTKFDKLKRLELYLFPVRDEKSFVRLYIANSLLDDEQKSSREMYDDYNGLERSSGEITFNSFAATCGIIASSGFFKRKLVRLPDIKYPICLYTPRDESVIGPLKNYVRYCMDLIK